MHNRGHTSEMTRARVWWTERKREGKRGRTRVSGAPMRRTKEGEREKESEAGKGREGEGERNIKIPTLAGSSDGGKARPFEERDTRDKHSLCVLSALSNGR